MEIVMKNRSVRLLCSLLALFILMSSLVIFTACGESVENVEIPTGDTAAQTVPAGTNEEPETQRIPQYESLEKEKFDREFVILGRSDMLEEFEVEKITGEILNDAVYDRNTVVSEDYDITLQILDGGDYLQVNSTLTNQVSAGDDEYDAFIGHKVAFMDCAQQNYLYDLNDVDTMNLSAIYWDQACRENLSLMGHNFMMTGDINPGSMLISACLVFNKDMNTELGKTPPYEMVDNGTWTLDTYLQEITGVSQDLNNDGVYSYKDDMFSTSIWRLDGAFSLFYGAGGMFVTINEDNAPELSYDSERVIDIYEKLYDIVVSENAFYLVDINSYGVNYDIFSEGRALYCDVTLNKISTFFDDMEEPYGIVPVPKYDVAQDEYLSFVNGASPFMMLAQSEKDPEFVGTILEAMAAYNYDNITPKMFEIVTKLQSARDPESSRMVDYIIRNRIYDFGYFIELGITNVVMNGLSDAKETIASDLKSNGRQAEKALERLIRDFKD